MRLSSGSSLLYCTYVRTVHLSPVFINSIGRHKYRVTKDQIATKKRTQKTDFQKNHFMLYSNNLLLFKNRKAKQSKAKQRKGVTSIWNIKENFIFTIQYMRTLSYPVCSFLSFHYFLQVRIIFILHSSPNFSSFSFFCVFFYNYFLNSTYAVRCQVLFI